MRKALLIGLLVIWVCDYAGIPRLISVLLGVITAVIFFRNPPNGRPA